MDQKLKAFVYEAMLLGQPLKCISSFVLLPKIPFTYLKIFFHFSPQGQR
jgi:hypothetical protein